MNDLDSHRHYFETLLNSVGAIIWEADFKTSRLSFVSRHVEELLGYPLENWLQDPGFFVAVCHPDDLSRIVEAKASVTPANCRYEVIYRMRHADGRWVWLSDRCTVVFEGSDPRLIRAVSSDVSERRRIEEALALVVEVIAAASELESIEEISLQVSTKICQMTGFQYGLVWFPEADQDMLNCSPRAYYSTGLDCNLHEESQAIILRFGEGLPGRAAEAGGPLISHDLSFDPRNSLAANQSLLNISVDFGNTLYSILQSNVDIEQLKFSLLAIGNIINNRIIETIFFIDRRAPQEPTHRTVFAEIAILKINHIFAPIQASQTFQGSRQIRGMHKTSKRIGEQLV